MGWLNAVTGQALVIAGMGLAAGAAPAHQAPLASALLSAVEGTDGAACHLILSALENRWGGSSVRPKMMLGGLADPRAGEVATWAQRGEPGSLDVDELMAGLTASDPCVQGWPRDCSVVWMMRARAGVSWRSLEIAGLRGGEPP